MWTGTVQGVGGPAADDGTFTTINLPVPALPAGLAVPLHVQGVWQAPTGALEFSQVWTCWLHG